MGWKQISNYFENRTSNACQFRWRRLKSGKLKTHDCSKTVKLEHDYLHGVRNHRTGSLLVEDLNARKLKRKLRKAESPVTDEAAVAYEVQQNSPYERSYERSPYERSSYESSPPSFDKPQYEQQYDRQSQPPQPVQLAPIQLPKLTEAPALATNQPQRAGSIWSNEENQLIRDRVSRRLSFDELCILMPSKTNLQIKDRIQQLEKNRLSIGSLTETRPSFVTSGNSAFLATGMATPQMPLLSLPATVPATVPRGPIMFTPPPLGSSYYSKTSPTFYAAKLAEHGEPSVLV